MGLRRIVLGKVHLGANAMDSLVDESSIQSKLSCQSLVDPHFRHWEVRHVRFTYALEIGCGAGIGLQLPPTGKIQSLPQLRDRTLDYRFRNAQLGRNLRADSIELYRLCQFLITRLNAGAQLIGHYRNIW